MFNFIDAELTTCVFSFCYYIHRFCLFLSLTYLHTQIVYSYEKVDVTLPS